MRELEARGLYDRRNPVGALPTSLRPALNARLGAEDLEPSAVSLAFRALGGTDGRLTAADLERTFRAASEAASGAVDEPAPLDYYSFQALLGQVAQVVWPEAEQPPGL